MSGMDGIKALIAVSQLKAENANQNALDGAERQRRELAPHSRLDELVSPGLGDSTPSDFHGVSELNGTAEGLASIDSAIDHLLHQIGDAQKNEQEVEDSAEGQADTVNSGGDPQLLKSIQALADMMSALRSPWL